MERPGATTVSVVTIVAGRALHLERMLAALRRCDPLPVEVVVVDMSPDTPARPATGHGRFPLRSVRCASSGPLPLARARNAGAASTSGDRIVFLDVDCLAAPDLISAYASAPDHAVANGPVRYLRRRWHRSWDGRTEVLDERSDIHPARPVPESDTADDRHHLLWTLSVGMARTIFDRLGGFDERFQGYGAEDTDFGFTARAAGVPMAWLASGTAYHQWHPTQDPPITHIDDIVANARRFRHKWGTWPMEGWLDAFRSLGLVEWDEDGEHLRRCSATPTGAPI